MAGTLTCNYGPHDQLAPIPALQFHSRRRNGPKQGSIHARHSPLTYTGPPNQAEHMDPFHSCTWSLLQHHFPPVDQDQH
uniref:Uncharacterized protein n=1 Tax=Manihot esculenta TaxID=3983 RepID=A0A2C9VXA9_MANES